jgi:hypothetical protein
VRCDCEQREIEMNEKLKSDKRAFFLGGIIEVKNRKAT